MPPTQPELPLARPVDAYFGLNLPSLVRTLPTASVRTRVRLISALAAQMASVPNQAAVGPDSDGIVIIT